MLNTQSVWKRIPTGIVLFLFFFSVYALTMSGWVQYGDETEKYRVAQSIVERGEFSFRPTQDHSWIGTDGKNYSAYELGQTVLEIPFYIAGKLAFALFPGPDINFVAVLFVGLLNPLLTALTAVLLFETGLRLGFNRNASLVLTLLFGLATVAFPYSRGFTREPLLGFLLLLTLYTVIRFEQTRNGRWLFAAGLAAGYLVFTKFIHAAVLPFFLIYVALVIYQKTRREGARLATYARAIGVAFLWFLMPGLILVVIQALYALARFGTPNGIAGTVNQFPLDHIFDFMAGSTPLTAIWGLLFSAEKSIFLYSPPLLLVPFAWVAWFRRDRNMASLVLAVVAVEFASSIFRLGWDGGGWWGPRYVVQITPLLLLSLGAFDSVLATARGRAAVIALFILGLAVQLIGALTNEREYMDIAQVGPYLFGQLDFIRHGALDSLVLYLSPAGFPIHFNPFAVVLFAIAGVLAFWLAARMRDGASVWTSSAWAGRGSLVLVLLIELVAFTVWVVAPYSDVMASKADTRFVTANLLLADGRSQQATAMYLLSLERGTRYGIEAMRQIDELVPHAQGDVFSPQDMMNAVEGKEIAVIEPDPKITLSGQGSLKIRIRGDKDAGAGALSDWIPVLPKTAYEISGWIKTEGVYGKGYAVVSYYEDNGRWKNPRKMDITTMDETVGWRPFRMTVTTLPTTQRIMLSAGLWNTYGTVWVEDIQLAKVSN